MNQSGVLLLMGVFLLCAGTSPDDEARAVGGGQEKFVKTDRFPGAVVGGMARLDGTLVLVTSQGVLGSSARSPLRWSSQQFIGMSKYHESWHCVGGDAGASYFTAQDEKGWGLWVLRGGQAIQRVSGISSGVASFASGAVGAVADGDGVRVTIDGGRAWSVVKAATAGERVTAMGWVKKDCLIVGGSRGSVRAFRVRAGRTERMWSTEAEGGAVWQIVADHRGVWIAQHAMTCLDIETGTRRAVVHPTTQVEGLFPCRPWVAIWNTQALQLWRSETPDGSYKLVREIAVPFIADVISLADDKLLAVSMDGRGWVVGLSNGQAVPAELEVSRTGHSDTPPDPSRASAEQIRTMARLASQLPREKRDEILSQANKKVSLTPRQRLEWTIEKMRAALAESER